MATASQYLLLLTGALLAFYATDFELSYGYEAADGFKMSRKDTVHILGADKVTRFVRDGQPVREMTGNVRLRQEETHLWANKVTELLNLDQYLMEGNVIIAQNDDTLFSDNVRYDSNLKIGHATGNVRLSDGEVLVFAPSAVYFSEEKRTVFEENVRLVDSVAVLTSLNGEYFSEEKRAEFFGDVVLEEDRTYMESDSVSYYRETEISEGYGNVFIERIGEERDDEDAALSDSTTRTFLFGDYVYNDNRASYSRIEGDALLIQLRKDSLGTNADSLLMKAATMEAIRKDSLQRLIAVDSVKIWRSDFSALADSAVYDRVSRDSLPVFEENRLFNEPLAWFELYQLSGDTLRATARDGRIDTLFVRTNAFAAFQDTVTNRINQLKGQHLLGLFKQDSLRTLRVGPQAEWIFFRKKDEGEIGAAKTSGDRIRLDFAKGELDAISVYEGIQGEYYVGSLIPEPFELSGYRWLPQLKPDAASLLSDTTRIERLRSKLDAEAIEAELETAERVLPNEAGDALPVGQK